MISQQIELVSVDEDWLPPVNVPVMVRKVGRAGRVSVGWHCVQLTVAGGERMWFKDNGGSFSIAESRYWFYPPKIPPKRKARGWRAAIGASPAKSGEMPAEAAVRKGRDDGQTCYIGPGGKPTMGVPDFGPIERKQLKFSEPPEKYKRNPKSKKIG